MLQLHDLRPPFTTHDLLGLTLAEAEAQKPVGIFLRPYALGKDTIPICTYHPSVVYVFINKDGKIVDAQTFYERTGDKT